MKGKLFSKSGEWFIETFDLYKFNHPAELEIYNHPKNFEFQAYKEVEFETIEIEDYVGSSGHTAYPTFTTKAIIL